MFQLQEAAAEDTTEEMQRIHLVVVGHVDHGKSTIIGRMLADTDSLPDGKLDAVRRKCEQTGKQFEYAFLLDALADEQAQGITIDAARIFFNTKARQYTIIDAPGHIEFLKNMVTGASHAEAALLVIDAHEGIQENSRRHAFMLSLLGVKSIVVLVNKMDQIQYDERAFNALVSSYNEFLCSIGIEASAFIPVSGLFGDNVAGKSPVMPWYTGMTVLEALDRLQPPAVEHGHELRLYVQDVYKFTKFGDDRRIVAGTIESGSLAAGTELVFFPSGKRSKVKSLELFHGDNERALPAGSAAAFTLSEQIYVTRGEMATQAADSRPQVSTRLKASVFWLAQTPLVKNKDYIFKIGTARVTGRLEEILNVIDAGSLDPVPSPRQIERNEVAEVILKLQKEISFDEVSHMAPTSRFVLVDDYRISGGGIIRSALPDRQSQLREQAYLRNSKWIDSGISSIERAEKYCQKPVLLLVTGPAQADRKALGRAIEEKLFHEGKLVYYMGIGNIVHGLDTDIEGRQGVGHEHVRRLAELANIMLDAGVLLIVTAAELTEEDRNLISTLIGSDAVKSVWLGEPTTDFQADIIVEQDHELKTAVEQVKELLYANHVIFRPW